MNIEGLPVFFFGSNKPFSGSRCVPVFFSFFSFFLFLFVGFAQVQATSVAAGHRVTEPKVREAEGNDG